MHGLAARAAERLEQRKRVRTLIAESRGALYSERLTLLDFFDNLSPDELRKAHAAATKALRPRS